MIRGRVQNGVVVLENRGTLREGTEVAVEPLPKTAKKGKHANGPTVGRRWRGLPARRRTFRPTRRETLTTISTGTPGDENPVGPHLVFLIGERS